MLCRPSSGCAVQVVRYPSQVLSCSSGEGAKGVKVGNVIETLLQDTNPIHVFHTFLGLKVFLDYKMGSIIFKTYFLEQKLGPIRYSPQAILNSNKYSF